MHELALCRSIEKIARTAAGERRVAVVELDVGELRQVVPSTLKHCWTLVCEGTPLESSRLDITRIPGVVECRDCGARTTLESAPILRCGTCASTNVRVVSGEEFVVTALQLEV